MVCLKRKVYYIIFLSVIILFLFIILNKNFSHRENIKLKKIPDRTFHKMPIKNIINNKVIIIGDSRMEFLKDRGKSIKIPLNFNFIALSGTNIHWFKNVALKKLEEKLDNRDKKYKYHVVINMGVNDLNDLEIAQKHADDYFNLFDKLVSKYNNVEFYYLSVNPINDKVIDRFFKPQYRTTAEIKLFNKEIIHLIRKSDYKNFTYCDSYNNVNFIIPDGLHYNKITDQRIINYIVNKCIKY